MFLFPMAFMLLVTLTSLILTMKTQILTLATVGVAAFIRLIIAAILFLLALVLAWEGIRTLSGKHMIKK